MTTTFAEEETECGRKAQLRAAKASLVRDKARSNRDTQLAAAATELLGKGPSPRLDGPEWDRFQASLRGPKWMHPLNNSLYRAAQHLPTWARRVQWHIEDLLWEQIEGDPPYRP
jgi:hypothetical protein